MVRQSCSMIFTTDADTVKYKKKSSLASKFLTMRGFPGSRGQNKGRQRRMA